jgi:hypothetical protein
MRPLPVGPTVLLVLALSLAPAVAAPARAQATPSRVDAWASVGVATAGAGEVTTRYVPELRFFTIDRGSAGQAVTIDSGARFASEFGIDVFLAEVVGIEAWVARDTLEPSSASGPYTTALRYVARPPPSYDPVLVDYFRADPWGAVATDVRRWTTAVNAVIRWGARRRVGGTVSGGLAFVRMSGEVSPLGYTVFVLGGHSTLFPNEYRLTADVEPTTEVRTNLGGTLDVRISPRVSVAFALRQVLGADATSSLRVTAVDRTAAGFDPPSNDDITAQLATSTVALPTASTRAMAGIKIGF